MQALFDSPRGHRVQLELPLREFLGSRLMQHQAGIAMCTPNELIAGYLPADPAALDAEEFGLALAEACEAATEFSVSHVRLDERDLRYAQRHLQEAAGTGGSGPTAA